MKNFIDEFRDSDLSKRLSKVLTEYDGKKVNIMEVCGTHTMAIFRFGIRSILNKKVNIVSGPGCPVCVTPVNYINSAIDLSRDKEVIIATFGDMLRVPGSESSLMNEKSKGANVKIVYSPLDSLKIAEDNPSKRVVFLSVGFETTSPSIALTVKKAKESNLKNFSILVANKNIPEALETISSDKSIKISGYIYPGNVSAIIGTDCYNKIADKYGIPGVVVGFEPNDILAGIIKLIETIKCNNPVVLNLYSRVVKDSGNILAQGILNEVFESCDTLWRGFGSIKNSGLRLRNEYKDFDATNFIDLEKYDYKEPEGCLCGNILKGINNPKDCNLFGNKCTPENPVGPCMVSSEGTCAAHYKYGGVIV